jgi:hypothetical protein
LLGGRREIRKVFTAFDGNFHVKVEGLHLASDLKGQREEEE